LLIRFKNEALVKNKMPKPKPLNLMKKNLSIYTLRETRKFWRFFFFSLLLLTSSAFTADANNIDCIIEESLACTDPAWSPTATYTQGNRASYNNKTYEAKWWTQNENPESKSGPYDVWKYIGACGGNANPTTTISSPANNASFNAPASITITATAADTDGTISKVDFYNGTTLLGTDTSSPYSFSWSSVAAGTYNLTVKATDNGGGIGTSAIITITVANSANPAPATSISSPANGATFTAPASIVINANASDTSPGTVSKVDFYNGTTLLGTDTSSPYSFSWTNVAAGTYTLTTKATDNQGAVGTSAAISVTVNTASNPAPSTTITSPANGATFNAPASITINANASDTSPGTVSKVDFYNGTILLGTDTSSPYSFSWTNVAAGSYTLTTRATDNQGAEKRSAAISITVNGTTGGCTAPQYVENGGYVAGSRVKNVNNQYECRPWPNSGWCNGGANAYAPGTGTNWTDAWTLVGPCSGTNNNAPSVSITSPANNATFSTVGQAIAIAASASDTDGTVSKVEFFVDATKVGEDTSSPYGYSWTSTQGFHALTAKATDNSANTTTSAVISITVGSVTGNLPTRIMSGYWHTWDGGVPFIKLRDVNSNWDVINVSFAEPVTVNSTDGRMKFVVTGPNYTTADFKADIKTLQSRGKKIVLAIGGYAGTFSLANAAAATQFANDIKGFVNDYGFDGIDIDTEQESVYFNSGADPDFKNPVSPTVVNLISCIRQIVNSYGANFILSWAPETFYFQMGKQWYGGATGTGANHRAGVYIPMIYALRDKTTYVQAQLYNSMAMQGPDGAMYDMGTVPGIVAMCKLAIDGFNVGGNAAYHFPGLRPDQVVIGVPASQGAAGSGQISNSGLQQAFSQLKTSYPSLRGIMAWSINWDAFQNSNSFVISNRAYLNGLGAREIVEEEKPLVINEVPDGIFVYPNPVASGETINISLDKRYAEVRVSIVDVNGVSRNASIYRDTQSIVHPMPALAEGLHILKVAAGGKSWTRKIMTH
jgi:chitinase